MVAGASATLMTYQLIPDVVADLPAIVGLGFDSVMAYDNTNFGATATLGLLDSLQQHGLKGFVDIRVFVQYGTYNGTTLTTRIDAIKDHPALAGWFAHDEPTVGSPAASQLETAYTAIKAADSTHPVVGVYPGYGSGFWPSGSGITAYTLTAGMQDVFSIDTYPINGSGLEETTYRAMLSASLGATPSAITERVMTMQAFGFSGVAVPTASQLTRLAEIAVEERWATRGMWMWLWHWDPTLPGHDDVVGRTWLKAMVADSATTAAVRAINRRHRSNAGKVIGLGGDSRLRASGAAFLAA